MNLTTSGFTANGRARRDIDLVAPRNAGYTTTNWLHRTPHHAALTGADVDGLLDSMVRLDEPYPAIDAADRGSDGTLTAGVWVGEQLAGVASLSRQQPPGAPMRGFYRIHGVRVRTTATDQGGGYVTALIEHCVRYAEDNQGLRLWCYAALDNAEIWNRHGFAIAGPPAMARNKRVGVLRMRQLTDAR